VDDTVVDDYDDVLWRLKSLNAIQSTRGTKVLALGQLQAYSRPGQELGPKHARGVWGFDIVEFPHARLEQVRADPNAVRIRPWRGNRSRVSPRPNDSVRDPEPAVHQMLRLPPLDRGFTGLPDVLLANE